MLQLNITGFQTHNPISYPLFFFLSKAVGKVAEILSVFAVVSQIAIASEKLKHEAVLI